MVELRIGDEHLELSWDEWESRVRSGRVPPTALVRFEPATGEDFVLADALELYHSLRDDGVIAWHGQFASVPPLLTALLVGVQVRLWWLATWTGTASSWVLDDLTLHTSRVLENGEAWRVLTMGFSHKAAFHLGLNMLWLGYCGWNLERALGRVNLLVLYLASVFVGSLFSMFGDPDVASLGASGGVFGLVSASIVFGFVRPHLLPERGRRLFGWALVPYVIAMFGSGLASEGTDNWSHLGGLLCGASLALILDPPTLQRRPRWNAAWSAGIATAIAMTLVGFAILGPRLVPLRDHDDAQRIGGLSPDMDPATALNWRVPVGWKRGRNAAGELAFVSHAGHRAWSVLERDHDAPRSAEAIRDAWVDVVRAAWPDALIEEARQTTLGGHPALGTRVVLTGATGGDRTLDHRVVVRGLSSLEATWQVEVRRAQRLAPMEDRVRASLRWGEPPALVSARIHFEHDPSSAKARDAWATELARVGRTEEALALRRALVTEHPQAAAYWSGMLDLLAWYPDLVGVPEAEAILQAALDAHPSGSMAAAVARVLDVHGDPVAAQGLLDLAWIDLPGDRSVRRARVSRDLSVALDASNEPWELGIDPVTGASRTPEQVAAMRAQPLTVASARAQGAARLDEQRRLLQAAVEAVEGADLVGAIDRSAWLRDGQPAATPEARAAVHADLAAAAGERPPRWLPAPLVDAARRRPVPAP